MSRRRGPLQRRVLAVIQAETESDRWWTMRELALAVFAGTLSRGRVESVRRAVKSLAAVDALAIKEIEEHAWVAGRYVYYGEDRLYRPRHYGRRVVLLAHRPSTVVENTAQRNRVDEGSWSGALRLGAWMCRAGASEVALGPGRSSLARRRLRVGVWVGYCGGPFRRGVAGRWSRGGSG